MDKLTKSAKNAQNYDPCRLFKAGDIVEPVERWGRKLRINAGHYRIDTDEVDNRVMMTHCKTGFSCAAIDAVYLELVTPVEEIQQFFLESDNNLVFGIYFGTSQNYELVSRLAKKFYTLTDAEAECSRLNEEHRKEQN